MIDVLILAAVVFVLSLIFDKSKKKGVSKIKDKFKMASSSVLPIILWGIVIIGCIALFGIICRFILMSFLM